MNLQTNEPAGSHAVGQVRNHDTIDPRLDRTSLADDAILVPLTLFEGLPAQLPLDLLRRIQPLATASFVVDQSSITVGRNLHLIAVHTTILEFRFALTAKLDTRVQSIIHLDFKLQFEIGVVTDGTEKGIGTPLLCPSANRAFVNLIFGGPVNLFPAVEGFTIKQGFPIVCRDRAVSCVRASDSQRSTSAMAGAIAC